VPAKRVLGWADGKQATAKTQRTFLSAAYRFRQ